MSDQLKPPTERLQELLADQALVGLSESERAELRACGASSTQEEKWELAAAAATVALLGGDCQTMPQSLRDRIAAAAPAQLVPASVGATDSPSRSRRTLVFAAAGWLAAAVLLVAFLTQVLRPAGLEDPGAARQRLLREGGEVRTIAWTPAGPKEPALTGDVVWSDARQEGYMRFRGLPANDTEAYQYQLWIFDADRDERFPVDGGVFDIPRATDNGEVIVPIRARLTVGRPVLFAITRERPGGVVVSDRKQIACVAKVG